jgi:ferredoxin-type protein NapF
MRPPRALAEQAFVEACTRCNACLDQCPEGIIVRGTGGLPEVDFRRGECTFCEACVQACPEGALQAQIEPPWSARLQLESTCLALEQIICQSCADACDQQAIRFTPRVGAVATPQINQDSCNACGACISSCPAHALRLESMPRLVLNSPEENITHA